MTEDEAFKKWCPFARVPTYAYQDDESIDADRIGVAAANRDCEGEIGWRFTCAGSSCMGWRWKGLDNGYCGLAGTPE